jgi:hypothetical protein
MILEIFDLMASCSSIEIKKMIGSLNRLKKPLNGIIGRIKYKDNPEQFRKIFR